MNYFPKIETIDDVLPAVKGRDEFVVAERDWGIVIDYQVVLPDTFSSPLLRECRGIKFDLDGKLLARPYHKFFNLGEKESTQMDVLSKAGKFREDFIIMPKLDGSMIHPILWDDEVWYCTRMGLTDVAYQAASFVGDKLDPEYESKKWYLDFCYDLAHRTLTPIFEWCSRKQRIVLDYPRDELVLTAIRVNETGEYLTRSKMRALAEPYKIPMVGLYDGSWEGIEKFSKEVQDIENAEGYVIRWDDDMVKMKGEWYLRIHRAKDGLAHEKRVIAMILNESLDDVLPHLLEDDYDRVIRYRDDFLEGLRATTKELMHVVQETVHFTQTMSEQDSRRYFATTVVQGQPKIYKKILFDIWGKVHPYAALIGFLRKKLSLDVPGAKNPGSQSIVDDIRPLFGNINWLDY